MDNFDPVEAVMALEEVLEIEISDDEANSAAVHARRLTCWNATCRNRAPGRELQTFSGA
jgi:hypothetical protein